jgi:AraC family transcriptional regulator of arabinose operon
MSSPSWALHPTEHVYYPSKAGYVFATTDSTSHIQLPFYGIVVLSYDGRPVGASIGSHRVEAPAYALWAKDAHFDVREQSYVAVGVNPLSHLFRAFTKLKRPHVLPLDLSRYDRLRPLMKRAADGTITHAEALELFDGALAVTHGVLPKVPALDERARFLMQTLWERPRCSLAELAELLSLSYHRTSHVFAQAVGIPIRTYQLWQKLYRASAPILAGMSFTEAAHIAGFADSAHYSRAFQTAYGRCPTEMFRTRHVEIFCPEEFTQAAVPEPSPFILNGPIDGWTNASRSSPPIAFGGSRSAPNRR